MQSFPPSITKPFRMMIYKAGKMLSHLFTYYRDTLKSSIMTLNEESVESANLIPVT
jgi:hypothetical protein